MKIIRNFLLLIFTIPFLTLIGKTSNSLEETDPTLDLSIKGIQNYTECSIQEIKNSFGPPSTSSNNDPLQVLEQFNEIGLHLASRLAVLKYVDTLTDDPILIRQSKYGFWKVVRYSLLKDWKSKTHALIDHLDKEPTFTQPHQKFVFKKLLENLSLQSFTQKQQENIRSIINVMDEVTPYSYLKGKTGEKKLDGPFTLLSFNICFTPQDMPLVFGGMAKWEERIDQVAQIIQNSDADVICLQEVFDAKAHEALYDKLKNNYAHFYTHIGPWSFEGSFSTLGFEGGLFVASKYPVANPKFIPFKDDNPHIHRGFFTFEIQSKNGNVLGKIFTTHLEPFDSGKSLRDKEFKQILKQMHLAENNQNPLILCGDLNMTPDESKTWIESYFIDDFQSKAFTHCDFTSQRWNYPNKNPLKPSNLDYTLLLKTDKYSIHTSLIKAFEINDLEHAVSDHQALLTKVSQKN